MPTKIININGDIEIYKGTLSDILKENLKAIIGDLKIENAKELKDLTGFMIYLDTRLTVKRTDSEES